MNLISRAAIIVASMVVSSLSGFAQSFSDNFAGATLDPAKWQLENDGGSLVSSSGRLDYVRAGTPTSDDFAVLFFTGADPGYNGSWEVIVDVTNTATRTNPSTQHTGAGILILDNQNTNMVNEIFLELGNENRSGVSFSSNFITNDQDFPSLDAVLTSGTSGRLRISYNGNSKVFSIWVDTSGSGDGFQWQSLASYGIAGSGGTRNTNWGMSANGTFQILLYGLSANLVVNSGTVTFDNFHYNEAGTPPPVDPGEKKAPQIVLVGNNVQLTIDPTTPGRRYQAQHSDSLTSEDWDNVGEEDTGNGGPLVIIIPRAPELPRGFYRVALDPAPPVPAEFALSPTGTFNPLFFRLLSGHRLFQRPSHQKQIPGSNNP